MILVVGGDSLIGAELIRRLQHAGTRVVGTTRRRQTAARDRLYLDLSAGIDEWQLPSPLSAVVVCAGVTTIEDCRRDPASSFQINVISVVDLIERSSAAGAFTVYLSTNQVFDGSIPKQRADDALAPQTEYGKQKAEVERRIASCCLGQTSIVRLSKVLGRRWPLLQGWVNALRNAEVIHPFRDMVMSPIPLCFVVTVLERLCERRLPGIFQVSSDIDVTYAQVAYYLAEKIGASPDLIQPVDSAAAGIPREAVPPHTSLDVGRLRTDLGLEPPSAWTTIDEAVDFQGTSI
jgi:dTDP-4-dehydrorhamnose reductase